MRKLLVPMLLAVAAGLAACSGGTGDSTFCTGSRDALKAGTLNPTPGDAASVAATIETLRKLEKDAPQELKDDFQVLIGSFEKVQAGNVRDVSIPDITTATDNINTYLEANCDVKITN